MPKAKKKQQSAPVEPPVSPLNLTQHVPEDRESLPSCSSQTGSVESVSKISFLEAKIEWQGKMIKDLEEERNFLRQQLMGENKTTPLRKATIKKEKNYQSDADVSSSPNISETDSDGAIPKKKKFKQSDDSDDVAVLGRTHMRVKRPDEAVQRYKQVLKTFQRVRTMTEAFRANNVDRGTIKLTAPIAELSMVDPDTFKTLTFDSSTETLISFANRCANNVTTEKKTIIESLKSKGKLLPLMVKY